MSNSTTKRASNTKVKYAVLYARTANTGSAATLDLVEQLADAATMAERLNAHIIDRYTDMGFPEPIRDLTQLVGDIQDEVHRHIDYLICADKQTVARSDHHFINLAAKLASYGTEIALARTDTLIALEPNGCAL